MDNLNASTFYAPKYWPYWVILGLLRAIIFILPYYLLLIIGQGLGRGLFLFSKKWRSMTQKNIELCFPELSKAEQEILIKKNFISSGIAIIELLLAWFGSEKKLRPLVHISGIEHLQAAQNKGKGVLLIGVHFLTLELAGRLFALDQEFCVVYRRHKQKFVAFLLEKLLNQHYSSAIERSNLRQLITSLKQGKVIWYAPDIDAGYFRHVFADFFGVPAATLTMPSRLANLTGATVLFSSYYRREDKSGYDIIISPLSQEFPTKDDKADAEYLNKLIEEAVRKKPEQYLWQYKRFKTRPDGEKRFY